jgi:hypothetical protein
MFEMVRDRIAAGETTVVSTAAVLRCGKQMEILPHYNFSWIVSLQKQTLSLEVTMDLSRDRLIPDISVPSVNNEACGSGSLELFDVVVESRGSLSARGVT